MKKYNLVLGGNGQDGFFMTRYLSKNRNNIISVVRKNCKNIQLLINLRRNNPDLKIIEVESYNKNSYQKIFLNYEIEKIFYFIGHSKIPSTKEEERKCLESNYLIFKDLLEFLVLKNIVTKVLYLSSAEIYGSYQENIKNENSNYIIDNIYSETKIESHKLINYYRSKCSFFISTAICYNHESFFSPRNHLIRSIIDKFNNFVSTKDKKFLHFTNIDKCKNISHTYDFLPIFQKILELDKPDDYVLANSSNNKIIDLIRIIAKEFHVDISLINLDINNILFRESRIGDNTKITKIFNYKPIFSVEKTIKRMLSYQNSNFFINN